MDAIYKKILNYLDSEVKNCDDEYEEEARYSGSKEKTATASGAYWEARKIRDGIKAIIDSKK